MRRWLATLVTGIILALSSLTVSPAAQRWEKISDEERNLASVEGHPDAPAALLLKRTALIINIKGVGSQRDEYRRVKILTDAGRSYGTVSIPSTDYHRIRFLDARILLPDGRKLDLPKDARFEKEYDSFYRLQMTSFTMPEVQVGAIIEYKYSIFFDRSLRTWEFYLQDKLPVLRSEAILQMPETFQFTYGLTDPLHGKGVKPSVSRGPGGDTILTYTLHDLEAIPEETFSLPWEETSLRVAFLPARVRTTRGWQDVHMTWDSVVDYVQEHEYTKMKARTAATDARARALTASAASALEKAETLYWFVRDEIGWSDAYDPDALPRTLDEILQDGRGMRWERAVLLHRMLTAVGIVASVGWTSPRDEGMLQRNFPLYSRVSRWIVVAEIDGRKRFMDPSDDMLAFDSLEPELQNVPCLLVDQEPPAWVHLPLSPRDKTQRQARVQLQVGGNGGVTGSGALSLTGNHAWLRLGWKPSPDESTTAWKGWLSSQYPAYEVSDVQVVEDVEGRRVKVDWSLTLRDEESLGDEVVISLAAPLALHENPFAVPPDRRYGPVHFPFIFIDQVDVTVSWPEQWSIDLAPQPGTVGNAAGRYVTTLEIEPGARKLSAERRLELNGRDFKDSESYSQLRELYQTGTARDAETLILIRR